MNQARVESVELFAAESQASEYAWAKGFQQHIGADDQLIQRLLARTRFVGRFDVASYYRSIRHDLLVAQLRAARVPERLRALIDDYLRLPDTRATGRGLVAGGGLSPLLGALHLLDVDRALGNKRLRGRGVYYLRYMDDILILTRTRWQLRHAIATLRRMLGKLDLALHRDKRFIGRTSAGFDFLGYRIPTRPPSASCDAEPRAPGYPQPPAL